MQSATSSQGASRRVTRDATSRWAALAAAALVLATPVVAWWLVGDRSEKVPEAEHLLPPVVLGRDWEPVVGGGAAIVAAVGLVAVVRAFWRRRLSRRWLPAVVLLVLAGVTLGAGWRFVSAKAAGVSHDAALALLFGLPLFVALTGAAIATAALRRPAGRRTGRSRRERRRRRRGWWRKRSKRTNVRDNSPVSSAGRV